MQNPRQVDMNHRQSATSETRRRSASWATTFPLLLWVHIKTKLSAGRVQSIALKLLVERQREISINMDL